MIVMIVYIIKVDCTVAVSKKVGGEEGEDNCCKRTVSDHEISRILLFPVSATYNLLLLLLLLFI
jgi:hypothetical protein